MTNQTSDLDTTYLAFAPFPSEPENHYRSIRGEVTTEAYGSEEGPDYYDYGVNAEFSVAFNGAIVTVPVAAYGVLAEGPNGLVIDYPNDVEHFNAEVADLDHFNQQWLEFYSAARSALTKHLP